MSSCWDCSYQQLGGKDTFLGFCTWFIKKGEKMKDIPPHVVDKGCKYFKPKTESDKKADKIIKQVITLFDGEVIAEKPIIKKSYRKNYKTKHKYGKRKDW